MRSELACSTEKLRVVSERTKTKATWVKWALIALQSVYGYEYQGDNLLLARINLVETFAEHCKYRWGTKPTIDEIARAVEVVVWNLWQMDGLTGKPPREGISLGSKESLAYLFDEVEVKADLAQQLSLFDFDDCGAEGSELAAEILPFCTIYNWETNEIIEFVELRKQVSAKMKKFYAVIGNPPYQGEGNGNKTFAPPCTTILWMKLIR